MWWLLASVFSTGGSNEAKELTDWIEKTDDEVQRSQWQQFPQLLHPVSSEVWTFSASVLNRIRCTSSINAQHKLTVAGKCVFLSADLLSLGRIIEFFCTALLFYYLHRFSSSRPRWELQLLPVVVRHCVAPLELSAVCLRRGQTSFWGQEECFFTQYTHISPTVQGVLQFTIETNSLFSF